MYTEFFFGSPFDNRCPMIKKDVWAAVPGECSDCTRPLECKETEPENTNLSTLFRDIKRKANILSLLR